MYSIAKIHYTTITMNKEGAACFMKKTDVIALFCKLKV